MKEMHAGLIMSKSEGAEVLSTLNHAHRLGYIDAPTFADMAIDVMVRVVP